MREKEFDGAVSSSERNQPGEAQSVVRVAHMQLSIHYHITAPGPRNHPQTSYPSPSLSEREIGLPN